MASRYAEHGIYVRNMLEDTAPQWLPTPKQEIEWHFDDLVLDLVIGLDMVEKATKKKREKAALKLEEACWALAVLWHDPPPPATSDDIKTLIDGVFVPEEVKLLKKYYDLLQRTEHQIHQQDCKPEEA